MLHLHVDGAPRTNGLGRRGGLRLGYPSCGLPIGLINFVATALLRRVWLPR